MCACNLSAEDKSKAKEDIIILLTMKLLNQLSWFMGEGLSSFGWTFAVQLLDAHSINSLNKKSILFIRIILATHVKYAKS